MTDNEKEARIIIEKCFEYNAPFINEYDLFPELTDEECWSIATNYPLPFKTIRGIFPKVGCRTIELRCFKK